MSPGSPHRHEADTALLDDHVVLPRCAPVGEPSVAGAERGVAGERQLGVGGEDPDPIVGLRIDRREHERGLRQVRPGGDALHVLGVESFPLEDHRHGVAQARLIREDVDLLEAPAHLAQLPAASASTYPPQDVTGGKAPFAE